MSDLFYCYSKKLSFFIRAFGIRYENVGLNKNTNTKYYTFIKSDILDEIIELYNSVKNK